MIQKIKMMLLSLTALLVMAPAAIPAVASAANSNVNQGTINSNLGCGSNLDLTPNCNKDTSGAGVTLNDRIATVINVFSIVVGIVAVIMIIVGGFRYITSGGSDTSVTSAKNTILYAIIGLVIVALAQILVRFTLSKITYGY